MPIPPPIDHREDILSKFFTTLQTLGGGTADGDGKFWSVSRDRDQLPQANADSGAPAKLPGCVLLDGKEQLLTHIKGHQFVQMPPAYFTIEPQVWIVAKPRDLIDNATLNQVAAPIGPELSMWRAKVLKAVLQDQNLILSLGPGGQMEYRGCETDMAVGSTIVGQMMMQFALTYALNVRDL